MMIVGERDLLKPLSKLPMKGRVPRHSAGSFLAAVCVFFHKMTHVFVALLE